MKSNHNFLKAVSSPYERYLEFYFSTLTWKPIFSLPNPRLSNVETTTTTSLTSSHRHLHSTSNKAFKVIRKAVAELRHGKNVPGRVYGVQNANAIKS
ncbi:hypothetical protein M0804_014830 [Polistes exclamans]|nr:hypothetical protein M0804_014831 [Polistes exclamans]KAI4474494.1 hypothetical protein M0804_014830 [Polistes exclamans]